ncbi:hypothetical protein VTH06DRAFT_6865 [Thermothelomyces fergusii]
MAISEYQYIPLRHDDEIRLLHLEPGTTGDVHFTLHPVRLSEKPSYEAISYHWGDPNVTQVVYCEGKPLRVTTNLYTGLKRLRRRDIARVLWADAVCINQKDMLEKNKQIPLMSGIYSQPSRVLVWLGENTDGIEGVEACIQGAMNILPPEHYDFHTIYPISKRMVLDSFRLRAEGKPNLLDYDWRPMNNLLLRRWFDRRWIIQEVTLADDRVPRLVICGDVEFSWNDLASVAYRIAAYGITPLLAGLSTIHNPHPLNMLSFLQENMRPCQMLVALLMAYLLKVYRRQGDLVDCLIATTLFQCGVPHDHLYSLLTVPQRPNRIVPDYRLSFEEVCMQFAEQTLVGDRNMRLLGLAPHTAYVPRGQTLNRRALPSWVPDLTNQGVSHPLVSYTIRPQCFHAGGNEDPDVAISPDRRLLRVRGRIVDKVAALATCQMDVPFPTEEDVAPKTGFNARLKKHLAVWLQECYDVAGEKYPREKARAETGQANETTSVQNEAPASEPRRAFFETLTCGMTLMRDPIPDEVLAAAQVFTDNLLDCFAEGYVESAEVKETVLTYGALIEQSLVLAQTRRFCRTEQGRLGQVRAEAREGDLFVCIAGAEVPYLLRPVGNRYGIYTLVGDAFLLGVMQGEAWSDARYETVEITIE